MSYRAPSRPYRTPYGGLGVVADQNATGNVSCGAGGTYADGNTLTVAGIVFEVDLSPGDGVAPGNVAVVFAAGATAQQVRAALLAAMQSPAFPFAASAGDFDTVVNLRMRTPGPGDPIVGTGGFGVGLAGFTGGALGTGHPARFGPVRAMVPSQPEELRAPPIG
ncbi:MAG: hypothetical protein HYZ29_23360 [Myxococcales bacterium]|nr:hypothetical protein [Myxococcales bacterium]